MESPILSVCLITYNHFSYIRQAIEGVLSQKHEYTWEFIIADDFSSDGTREIILQYRDQYPSAIRLILQEKNVGAAKNWIELISAATGKYIAYFEGDDYWTDPYKLKKQIEVLETNSDYIGCFHNSEERYDDDDARASFLYCNFPSARSISFKELCYSNLIPTCSILFKNKLFGDIPEWLGNLKMGDWPLHLLNAQYGDFWYIPKVMSVHRLHVKSTWMMQDSSRNVGYVVEAYDAMINEYADKPNLQKQLIHGRIVFIESRKEVKLGLAIKQRTKKILTRLIEKI